MKSFEKLEVFQFSLLQNLVTLIQMMETEKISIPELIEYVERKKIAFINQYQASRESSIDRLRQWEAFAKKCPDCGSVMALMPVNTMPSNMVGGHWRSLWYCQDWQNCGYDEFSKETYSSIVEKIYNKKRKRGRHARKQAKQ